MGQLWMLFSGIGCLLLGISAQNFQKRISSPEDRHLLFSDSYYAKLKNEFKGNLATSPLGIDELLQLITLGGRKGDITFTELNNVVRFPNTTFKGFLDARGLVNELLEQSPRNVECMMKNFVYVSKDTQISIVYKELLRRFKTKDTEVDFGDPSTAVRLINAEVASLTNNKIKNSISPDAISSSTVAILMNVLYFKGKWEVPFARRSTQLRPFFQNENTELNVPMMFVISKFKWFNDPEMTATVVEVPYVNEDFSMIIILPNEDKNLEDVSNKLHLQALLDKLAHSKKQPLQLNLPKFKIESSLDLKPTLKKMGINKLFTRRANLSVMTSTRGMHVSRVAQKIFLEVNEEGSEAFSVSSIIVASRGEEFVPKELVVNRPFLAILRYKSLNLFMARITNPLA